MSNSNEPKMISVWMYLWLISWPKKRDRNLKWSTTWRGFYSTSITLCYFSYRDYSISSRLPCAFFLRRLRHVSSITLCYFSYCFLQRLPHISSIKLCFYFLKTIIAYLLDYPVLIFLRGLTHFFPISLRYFFLQDYHMSPRLNYAIFSIEDHRISPRLPCAIFS